MKKIIYIIFPLLLFVQAVSAAIVSAGIQGTVNSPTTNASTPIANGAYAVLVVDTSGAGLGGLTTTLNLIEGNTYSNIYVASIFAVNNDFLGSFATSPVTSVSWESNSTLSTQPSTGDKYYIVWYQGTSGASVSSTQFTVTNGQVYGYASASDWLVPAEGSSATPSIVSSGFIYGTVSVPEPSVALLGALGCLALLRRRRN